MLKSWIWMLLLNAIGAWLIDDLRIFLGVALMIVGADVWFTAHTQLARNWDRKSSFFF